MTNCDGGILQVMSQILNRAQGLLIVAVAVAATATARRVRMKKTMETVARDVS